MSAQPQRHAPAPRNNGLIVVSCLVFVAAMVGMSFAAVPLYQMFCQVTGYGGTTKRVEQMSEVVLDKDITVRFDANTANGLAWEFEPVDRDVKLKIGETVQIMYRARNISKVATTGQATFNVTPLSAGAYFNKVQCFCFTETTLEPGEEMEMPVVFFVDPDIANAVETKDIHTLTLSYTFYPHEATKPVAAVSGAADEAAGKL